LASTSKVAFNFDGLTIHSTLNIPIQQSLFILPNLSPNSLNRFTCQYEQLQLVGVRMFNVMDNRLRYIKHIQNKFFGGVDVIMTSDFYQTPPMKDS
jgi:hypothetical protein